MENKEIARIFQEIGEILEIKDENPFRVRAYYKAAQVIESLSENVENLAKKEGWEKVPGIGPGMAGKLKEIIATGKLKFREELKKEVPAGLLELLDIPQIGPKSVKVLYQKLKIDSRKKLEKAVREGKIRDLPGMGEKTEQNILQGIQLLKKDSGRLLLGVGLPIAEEIITALKNSSPVEKIEYAGSLRRMKETVGDIDILATSGNPEKVMDAFTALPLVNNILAKGATKSSILTKEGIHVDVRVVPSSSFGAALHYFTGSKEHNIRIREMAAKKGLKINEYGIFKGKKKIGGEEEEEIFTAVGLSYIAPELREDRGEIEEAQAGHLPCLVKEEDIKGDLHVHSNWSDGAESLKELAEIAKKKGDRYLGICDHSPSASYAGGLSVERLKEKIKEVKRLNEKFNDFYILSAAEVDIKSDGSLDYPDQLLRELEIVLASIHTGFKQDKEVMTNRIINALENKYVNILAHPRGRLIGKRQGYELDMEKLLKAAAKTGTFLEINAYPERLDLDDLYARQAKKQGITMSINTDSHHASQLSLMKFGLGVARRAWLEKGDILNTLPLKELLIKLKQKRR